ncbi:MAG: hypothetical protein ABS85_09550 [Sphingobacteriales bacterium SCN 48-20]|nr:MAG: hypothetical protein ABS85_09550 [Sphingobacteriales bacterium SCN 48-20]
MHFTTVVFNGGNIPVVFSLLKLNLLNREGRKIIMTVKSTDYLPDAGSCLCIYSYVKHTAAKQGND